MSFKKLLNIFSRSIAKDGIRVIGRTGQTVVLERREGAHVETLVVPSSGVLIDRVLDGTRSVLSVQFGPTKRYMNSPDDAVAGFGAKPRPSSRDVWVREPGSEQACNEEYEALVRGLGGRTLSHRRAYAYAAFAALATAVLMSVGSPAPVAVSHTALPAAPSSPSSGPASGNASSKLDASEMADLKGGAGIVMGKGSTNFSVFTDPNCPYCRELELSLTKVNPALSPIVYPLGFKPGSRELSASILCSKDPAAAWKKSLLEGVAPTAPACEEGLRKVDANTILFAKLKLTSTPTMVSPSGQLVVGSGAPEQIAEVMSR